MRLDSRKIISWCLIFVPLILLIWQQVAGIFPFRDGTSDATIFYLLCGVSIIAGFVYQQRNPRMRIKVGIWTAAMFLGLPLLIGGIFAMGDVALGSEIAGGKGFFFALDTLGSQISEWTVILQFIVSAVPACVVISGVVLIYLAKDVDGLQTAVIETVLAIVIMVIAVLALGWLGVDVF